MKFTQTQSELLAMVRKHGKRKAVGTKALAVYTHSEPLIVQSSMARLERMGLVERIFDKTLGWNCLSWKLKKEKKS